MVPLVIATGFQRRLMLPCDGKESLLLTVLAPALSTGLFCIRVTLYVSLVGEGEGRRQHGSLVRNNGVF